MWRRYFKLPLGRIFGLAHEAGIKTMFHCCGSVRELLPDLIDIGLDIVMPVQVSAAGMNPQYLKREFGSHLRFDGGVDTQYLLPSATPEKVREQVRFLIDVLGEDGGYILASSQNLLADIPLENVLAMYDEACSYER